MNQDTVIAVWAGMQKRFATEVVKKSDSAFMKLVGGFIDLIGIQDRSTFLERYTTTIGRKIYMPYEIGDPSHNWIDQLALCAHEHQHVVQSDRDGATIFAGQYVFDRAARAVYEAEAYTCNLEILWWATRDIASDYEPLGADIPPRLAAGLKEGYGCTDDDVAVAAAALEHARVTLLRDGVIVNKASRHVIQLAEEHGLGARKSMSA